MRKRSESAKVLAYEVAEEHLKRIACSLAFGTLSTQCTTNDIPMIFGVPLDVQLSLTSGAHTISGSGVFSGNQAAGVDFTYQVLDANKNPVPFTAEVIIPEPSTSQLWIIGACLLPLIIKRRLRSLSLVAIRRN